MTRWIPLPAPRTALAALSVLAALGAGAPAAAQPSIVEVEVNQLLGRARAVDGTLSPASKFVAGKDTVVRVFLSAAVAADTQGTSQAVSIERDGRAVVTLAPAPSADPATVLTFRCPTRTACGDWAPGTYRFSARVGSATATRENVLFEARRPLRILAVPIRANYAGEVRVPDERWKNGGDFARTVFPVSLPGFQYSLREPLDLSGAAFDVTTEPGRRAVWEALTRLVPPECSSMPDGPGCFDAVAGFVKSRLPQGTGTLAGFTYGRPASVSVNDDGGMPAAVAHEIAHLYGIGDEYKGGSFRCAVNPPPPSYAGKDWDTGAAVKCTASRQFEPPPPFEGSLVAGSDEHPYEVNGRGPLSDMVSYMGSGFPEPDPMQFAWTTWLVFSSLYDQLKPVTPAPVRPLYTPVRAAEIALRIGRDGRVTFLPWTTFTSPDSVPQTDGTHSVYALDVTDRIIAVQSFTPAFQVRTNPPSEVDPASVEGIPIPFPAETRKVRVLSGGKVLAERTVSPNPPAVAITEPAEGSSLSGKVAIAWTATDADGDSLVYDVEYTQDVVSWHTLATGLTEPRLVVDFDELPGSPYARVRVRASDGFNTTTADLGPYVVASKPPRVFVDEPAAGSTVRRGTQTVLEGDAFDLQEGWLTGASQLVWSSSLDGELGRGTTLALDSLSTGRHLLSLTATSAAGVSGRGTVAVTVLESGAPDPPLVAAFQTVPASPAEGEPVRFEDLSTGTPVSFSWDLGDRTASTEQSPLHAYAQAGTFPVALTVKNRWGGTSTTTGSVTVRPAGSGAVASFFVPVVLRLAGLGSSDYSTEMTITNRGTRTATVSYTYTASVGEGSGSVAAAETVGPGRQLVVADVIGYLRGKGVPIPATGSRLGTLRVTVSGLASPLDASVLLRTTTPVPAGGRAGLAYSGVPESSLLTYPVALCGLRQTDSERSAVAVQNAGTSGDATFRLSLFDGARPSATPVGTATVTVRPGGFSQTALADLGSDLLAEGQGYVVVERTGGSAPFYAYGVVNDGVTSDGSFVLPVAARALSVVEGHTLPVVVDTGRYVTEVTLTNLSGSARTLDLTAVSAAFPGGSATATLTLPAGSQRLFPRFVEWLRSQVPDPGTDAVAGPLFVTAVGGEPLSGIVVSGRTWNLADPARPEKGAYGVAYAAVPYDASSTGVLLVNGLVQDGASRSNLALVNTGEKASTPVILRLELFDAATGTLAGESTEMLGARQFRQLDALLSGYPGVTSAWVRVSRLTGTNPFLAYGVINDGSSPGQGSGDGAFVGGDVPVP